VTEDKRTLDEMAEEYVKHDSRPGGAVVVLQKDKLKNAYIRGFNAALQSDAVRELIKLAEELISELKAQCGILPGEVDDFEDYLANFKRATEGER
jgi:hypothetical protein